MNFKQKIKRITAVAVSAAMMCGGLGLLPGKLTPSFTEPVMTAEAADNFVPRTTAPATDDWNYANGNIFYTSGYGMPNCTCYAYGRAKELLGHEPSLSHGNAQDWYGNTRDGYARGSEPKLGAIACWNHSRGGHVAVVEKIEGDTVWLSESSYGGDYFNYTSKNKNNMGNCGVSGGYFQGYIYIGDWVDKNILTIEYNTNGGIIKSNDYSIRADGTVVKDDEPVVDKFAEGEGDQYGLYNASTFGMSKPYAKFLGWSLERDKGKIFDEETKYVSNDLYSDITEKSATITLYARWEATVPKTYIKDIKVSGLQPKECDSDSAVQVAKYLNDEGYMIINYDLNKTCGFFSDWIYLGYKLTDNPDEAIRDIIVIDQDPTSDWDDGIVENGVTYNLCPFTGGPHFCDLQGDLNSHALGNAPHIFYTKDKSVNKVISEIWFDNDSNNSVSGMDLNLNAVSRDSDGNVTDAKVIPIYMHIATDESAAETTTTATTTATTTTSKTTTSSSTTTTVTTTASEELTLSETEITIAPGEKYSIKASQSGLTYKSSDESIAVVSDKGVISGIKKGTAVITAINKSKETASMKVTVAEVKYGDVNGDGSINLKDVVLLRRYIAGGWNVVLDEKVADVNKDGTVNLKDAVLLRRYIAGGWNVQLPQ